MKTSLRGLPLGEQERRLAPPDPDGTEKPGRRRARPAAEAAPATDLGTTDIRVGRFDLGALGGTPQATIDRFVGRLTTMLQESCSHARTALDNFQTRMTFPSGHDTQAHPLAAAWEGALGAVWDEATGALGEAGGESAPLFNVLLEILTSIEEEIERAAAADEGHDAGAFVIAARRALTDGPTVQIQRLDGARSALAASFSALDPDGWRPGERAVTGVQADFVRELEQGGQRALQAIPPTARYEAELLARWVREAAGDGVQHDNRAFDPRGDWHQNGSIELRYGSDFALQSAKLWVGMKPHETFDMLKEVMERGGKHVHELGIPVRVFLWGPSATGNGGDYTVYDVEGRPDPNARGSSGLATMDVRWRQFVAMRRLDAVKVGDLSVGGSS